jgi:hypothetical protein
LVEILDTVLYDKLYYNTHPGAPSDDNVLQVLSDRILQILPHRGLGKIPVRLALSLALRSGVEAVNAVLRVIGENSDSYTAACEVVEKMLASEGSSISEDDEIASIFFKFFLEICGRTPTESCSVACAEALSALLYVLIRNRKPCSDLVLQNCSQMWEAVEFICDCVRRIHSTGALKAYNRVLLVLPQHWRVGILRGGGEWDVP